MNACFQDEKDKSPDTLQPFYLKQNMSVCALKKKARYIQIMTNISLYSNIHNTM